MATHAHDHCCRPSKSRSVYFVFRLEMRMQRRRGSRADPVSEDDILRAIAKLGVLGGGFAVVKVGERRLVCALGLPCRCRVRSDLG